MSDKYAEARRGAAECVISLCQAIQDAGGKIQPADKLLKMSMCEFITTVASQNRIRFVFIPPEEPKDEKTTPLPQMPEDVQQRGTKQQDLPVVQQGRGGTD